MLSTQQHSNPKGKRLVKKPRFPDGNRDPKLLAMKGLKDSHGDEFMQKMVGVLRESSTTSNNNRRKMSSKGTGFSTARLSESKHARKHRPDPMPLSEEFVNGAGHLTAMLERKVLMEGPGEHNKFYQLGADIRLREHKCQKHANRGSAGSESRHTKHAMTPHAIDV